METLTAAERQEAFALLARMYRDGEDLTPLERKKMERLIDLSAEHDYVTYWDKTKYPHAEDVKTHIKATYRRDLFV